MRILETLGFMGAEWQTLQAALLHCCRCAAKRVEIPFAPWPRDRGAEDHRQFSARLVLGQGLVTGCNSATRLTTDWLYNKSNTGGASSGTAGRR